MSKNTSEPVECLLKVLQTIFTLLCLCHYTACAWYGIASIRDGTDPSLGMERNWVEGVGLELGWHVHCYVVAFHWSITQFTPATNNVVPVNAVERAFAILVVLTGFVSFSWFISSMFSTLNQLKSRNKSRVRGRQALMQFFRIKGIPAALGQRVLWLFEADVDIKDDCLVEADLPILLQLPTSIRIRLRREYCMPLPLKNQLLRRVHHIGLRCFIQVCYNAMSDSRYMSQQEIFLDGVDSSAAYVVTSGTVKYVQGGSSTALTLGAWVSDACLWVAWKHLGSLVASTCSTLVELDAKKFRRTVQRSGGHLHRCLCCVAVLYAHELEKLAENHRVTDDLGLEMEHVEGILWRTLKFCELGAEGSTTPDDAAVRRPRCNKRLLTGSSELKDLFQASILTRSLPMGAFSPR
ncbi:unnamed protein product [Prorocentrum cordatum]|uniref:Cyclic nucleotide-binding domain-containing protein n=1 Tax=Prorocentrum cordatum TaxID=2364126 RepID=A0ABN9SSS2_9DINO|nr:unnamed protein product [Polarella glacialis]